MQNKKQAHCIAVFGTASDVGKSVVATALCRCFVNRGVRVAPFKAQNMSNNSGVTPEGLEMGRAQIVQAEASKIPPHVDMNPILLKPTSDIGAQVVLLGEALRNSTAAQYHTQKKYLLDQTRAALDRVREQYDLVVIEGAGSCAEVNLMAHDIVNFRTAEYADAPVVLVADIHRGGVFAQLVGTLACLPEDQQERVAGLLINRFRGDLTLFEDGAQWIEQKTQKKMIGVLPWYHHISIEQEDSVVLEKPEPLSRDHAKPGIAVIRLPHISNFTDFEPLMHIDGLNLVYLEKQQSLNPFKAVILPGSKNTRYDLEWLRSRGWIDRIQEYAQNDGWVLGVCGGYQMLGSRVHDPHGLEGAPGSTPGLALLPVETTLEAPKTTTRTFFQWGEIDGAGYEIHMGRTQRSGGRPLFHVTERNNTPLSAEDGCTVKDFRIMGSYIHGLFDTPAILRQWLDVIGVTDVEVPAAEGLAARERQYDLLAAHFEKHIDIKQILTLAAGV